MALRASRRFRALKARGVVWSMRLSSLLLLAPDQC